MFSKSLVLLAILGFVFINSKSISKNDKGYPKLTPEEKKQYKECMNSTSKSDPQRQIKCFDKIPKLRPLNLFTYTVLFNLMKQLTGKTICGLTTNYMTTDPEFLKRVQKIKEVAGKEEDWINKDFCELASKTLPAYCDVQQLCKEKPEEMDYYFASYYAIMQIYKTHPDQFNCPNLKISEKFINSKAYHPDFDYMNEDFLVEKLPCTQNPNKHCNSTTTTTPPPQNYLNIDCMVHDCLVIKKQFGIDCMETDCFSNNGAIDLSQIDLEKVKNLGGMMLGLEELSKMLNEL